MMPQLPCGKIEGDQRNQARRPSLLKSHSQNYEEGASAIFFKVWQTFANSFKQFSKFWIESGD